MKKLLEIKNLYTNVGQKQILKGLDLEINAGEVHVIMGPNGAGKSTLANSIFNSPAYKKTSGTIIFDGQDISSKTPDEIARRGIFMSFQNPVSIDGISVFNFIKTAKNKTTGQNIGYLELKEQIDKYVLELDMKDELAKRDLNVGFSGGEKKKTEILQMLCLNPKLAILDETDSGLDVDAIKTVSKGIEMFKNENNAVLIITHSSKILEHLKVDKVHILLNGKIVKTGNADLIKEIEENGYASFKETADE
ncbi:MAG TPA: Fe-S cluster assembly ATPase SufC [Clostridiales bacterium]|nr:Fe-S cluster assembly ATPase SufC [Clostridiales bacterium]